MVTLFMPILTVFGLNVYDPIPKPNILSQKEIRLSNRQPVLSVNEVFKKNILLNLFYLDNRIRPGQKVEWDEITKPFSISFKLNPGEVFAYHDDVLPQYQTKVVKTTNAHFNATEGFLTDGYLYGDGVCHLASIIYWTAKEAGLDSVAPTNHNFASIPEVPKEYGVSIYNNPRASGSNVRQNLYITNNLQNPVTFIFEYKNDNLKVIAVES